MHSVSVCQRIVIHVRLPSVYAQAPCTSAHSSICLPVRITLSEGFRLRRLPKKTGKSSGGLRPFRISIIPRKCARRGRDEFCVGESHFPEQKSFPYRLRAWKFAGFQRREDTAAAEPASPPASLSKPFLGKPGRLPPLVRSSRWISPGYTEKQASFAYAGFKRRTAFQDAA